MTDWTNVFGGQPQNPSQVFLADLNVTADTQLFWPWVGTSTENLQAKIIRVTTDVDGRNIALADAEQASPGEATIFINIGSTTFNVNNFDGNNVATVAAGVAKFVYLIDNTTQAGSWGVFTFGAGSSSADAGTLAGAGLMAIAGTLNEAITATDFSGSGFNLTSASRANLYNWTSGSGTLTTDDPSTLGGSWFAMVRNSGSGTLAVTPAAGTIDGASSKNFNPGDTAFIIRDGANLITLGFGQSAAFSFDYIAINAAGSGTLTLNAAQQNRIAYKFTGVLTGDRTIVVPATVQQYWITNATTGAFNFYVKTAAQAAPGVQIAQNQANILYCDGTNVVAAVSGSGISTPVSIANGGTGATTASGARTNLGATTVGNALFTAASASAAAAAINAAVVNANNNFSADQTVISTDAGAGIGPVIAAKRNSASPIAGDLLGVYDFIGKDSAGNDTIYSRMNAIIVDPTDGVETGSFTLQIPYLGALKNVIQIGTSAAVGSSFAFSSFDAGAAVGPTVSFSRDSASPAASDLLAVVQFLGRNSGGGLKTYAQISAQILDTTSASEDGLLLLGSIVAGTAATRVSIGQGMFTVGATGGDPGTGKINATDLQINGVSVATSLSGTTIQTQRAAFTTYSAFTGVIPDDDTIPQISEGDLLMSLAFTPKASTSTIDFSISVPVFNSTTVNACVAVYVNGTADAICARQVGSNTATFPKTIQFECSVAAGSTSVRTYQVRIGVASGTIYVNGNASARRLGGVESATIKIQEVAA